jgi:PAS domain S-box-containing protein
MSPSTLPQPIVHFTASECPVDSLARFFATVPPEVGMTFVITEQAAPDFQELMRSLSNRYTIRVVGKLRTPVELMRDTIYLAPPRVEYVMQGNLLRFQEATKADELALRMHKVSQQLPGMVYQFRLRPDGSSCFPYASEGIREIYRVTPEEVHEDATKVSAVYHPEDSHRIAASMQVSAQTLERWQLQYRVRYADGVERWLLGNSVPEREPDGSVLWHGFVTDITERKLQEAAAEELMMRIHKINQLLPGLVFQFLLRPDGTSCMPFASDVIRSIFRLSPEDVREDASALFALVHPHDLAGFHASIRTSADTLRPWHHEFRIRFPDGVERWLLGDSVPERANDGQVLWHGFIRDITERKIAEKERRQIENKLVESAKLESLGVLAGGIAHDFNNLLTGILGNASLARQDLPPSSPGQPMLDQIEQSARRAADLCKQMLAYSGRGRFMIQRLDLNTLIEDTTHLLQISISKNCVLRFNLATSLPAISADATQLRQIIMNLVINASEAIGSRSGVLALNTGVARVDAEYLRSFRPDASPAPGDYVFIEVSDNGCGMDAATLARIFDPFFTTKFTGRGLGLAAVLGIVRGHKGGLKVYSEVGKGTTFKLFFPCAAGKAEAIDEPHPTDPQFAGSGTVLIADDEETVRTVAARMLEYLGFSVVLASDGREAVEKFRAEPSRFVFVLLDLTMPHLDGEEAFRQLRLLNPGVRVILTSGFNHHEAINRFVGKGLAGFIQKPFELAGFTKTVRSVLQET